jgi:hypothetical protein
MTQLRFASAFFAMLIALSAQQFASAQYAGSSPADPRPASDLGGLVGNQMRALYRSDVGTGFTSASLNSIALQSARGAVGNFGQASANGGGLPSPSASFGGGGGGTIKPFTGVTSAPTVSPYLNLFREDRNGNDDFNYQTLVRPQLQQNALNSQLQRQNLDLSRRVQSIAAHNAFQTQGATDQSPTGHETAFGYTGHYFPQSQGRKK